ncbi:MAG: tetratricopeptide repeat protein, partial [Bacteroidota bacterium]
DRRIGYLGAARVCRILKDFSSAISYLQNFLTTYPDDPETPEVLYTLGDTYAKDLGERGAEKNAIDSYQMLLTRYPRSALADDALFSLADVHERAKQFDQALNSYKELITRYPSSPFVGQAKERIHRITTFEPTPTSTSLDKLAQLLASLIGGEAKGESAFHLGEIYLNDLKNFEAAMKMFTSAIENKVAEPNLAEAYYYRARSQQLLAEKNRTPSDTALKVYEEFLKHYPSHPHSADAAAQIALLKISSSPQVDISKIAEGFVLKYPGSAAGDLVVLAAADTLMGQGKYDKAALSYQQLLAWFPSSARREEALFRLGLSMEKLGKKDSTRAAFETYLRSYPEGSHGTEVLGSV